jgi:hypothetical protein
MVLNVTILPVGATLMISGLAMVWLAAQDESFAARSR